MSPLSSWLMDKNHSPPLVGAHQVQGIYFLLYWMCARRKCFFGPPLSSKNHHHLSKELLVKAFKRRRKKQKEIWNKMRNQTLIYQPGMEINHVVRDKSHDEDGEGGGGGNMRSK